jgi:hypothetical protein
MTAICGVEKLEFQPRSQFRRPLAVSMEISLGVRRRDRSFCVQPSLRPCRGDYPCRRHYTRGSETFLAPQFPTFSSISAHSGRPESTSSGHGRSRPRTLAVGRFPDLSAHRVEEAVWRRFLTFRRPGLCHTRRSGGMNACPQVVGLKASITPSPKANRERSTALSTDDLARSHGRCRCLSGIMTRSFAGKRRVCFLLSTRSSRNHQDSPICRPAA